MRTRHRRHREATDLVAERRQHQHIGDRRREALQRVPEARRGRSRRGSSPGEMVKAILVVPVHPPQLGHGYSRDLAVVQVRSASFKAISRQTDSREYLSSLGNLVNLRNFLFYKPWYGQEIVTSMELKLVFVTENLTQSARQGRRRRHAAQVPRRELAREGPSVLVAIRGRVLGAPRDAH